MYLRQSMFYVACMQSVMECVYVLRRPTLENHMCRDGQEHCTNTDILRGRTTVLREQNTSMPDCAVLTVTYQSRLFVNSVCTYVGELDVDHGWCVRADLAQLTAASGIIGID